jgi:CHAT domain-containing protein/Tfp pilus assembly protein PilF
MDDSGRPELFYRMSAVISRFLSPLTKSRVLSSSRVPAVNDRHSQGSFVLVLLLLASPAAAGVRPLTPGGADHIPIELAAGKHWLVSVEQDGIDAVVEVKDPRGRSVLAVDSPLGREGTETLLLTPKTTGRYGVEVRCEEKGAPAGRYEIRLQELPATAPADRLRLRAEAAMTDAGRLYRQRTAAARKEAQARLGEALKDFRTLGDQRRQAETLWTLGRLLEELDASREAAERYQQALALFRALDDGPGMAATLDGLGVAYNSLGENPRAQGYLEEALTLRRRLGQPEAGTRNDLCLVLQRQGRFRAAGACYETALALARELKDRALEATVLNNLGGIDQNLGEPAGAIAHFQQALELQRALGNELGEGATLNNLGFYDQGLGEVEEALLHYGSALAIFERLGNRSWQARTLNNIGFAYLALGELERARSYLLRALPLRRAVGDKSGEAVTLRNLGRAALGLGQPVQALAFLRRALENSLALSDRRGAATAHKLLGEIEVAQDRFTNARSDLELALASQRQMGGRQEEAEVLTLLSGVHRALGELPKAEALAGQALALHRAVRNPLGEIAALTALARAERAQGRPAAVADNLRTALAALENLHGHLGDPNQKAAFLASQREVYELYVETLMELHRRAPAAGHDRAALEASERAHSRSLLALLEGAGAGLGRRVEPALRKRLRDAERRFAAKTSLQLQVLGRDHSAEAARAAEQDLYGALTELDNARAELRRQDPRYAALAGEETLAAPAIRALLDDDTVLLEFLLGEDRSFLWWVTPASVTAFELPSGERITRLAEEVYRRVSDAQGSAAATREALGALGRMLLGPVADRLRDQRLVIIADGALHLVPFAALTLGGEPVISRHEVVNLPSASVLALQRRELAAPFPATPRVAVFADPALGAQDRLPMTRLEAESIAAQVPADRLLLALGSDARRERVVDGELKTYQILHFATHGFLNPQTPELSGLMLSRVDAAGAEIDGFLGLYDVASLDLSAQLVVLSGCHTALGKQVRGEGLVGLSRGFLYAGVPRVVSSLWQVRDRATAELMARFYRGMLGEGSTPAAALRAAQLALRQERRWRDPFFWAAFTLQGDWR